MEKILFLEPVLQEKLWGGQKLATEFNFELPSDKIGEAWCISAHPHGVTKVRGDNEFAGKGLDEVYQSHPELFGKKVAEGPFPLLVKILDAHQDLSVQVHPDDAYAQSHEGPNELGKTECWYVIDAEPGASIIFGHTALNDEEFRQRVAEEAWDNLLRKVEVQAGDFFYVPHGTIHAIGAGVLILETQQSSDTTYRVYDYHRKDSTGKERELHLEDAIQVTQFPHIDPDLEISHTTIGRSRLTHYVTNQFFTVNQWDVCNDLAINLDKAYYLATVIDGEGAIETGAIHRSLKKGDAFIIPHGVADVKLRGKLSLIVSNPE